MSPTTPNWTRPASLESWGAAIRRQRESVHLTLDVLANKTGISKPYLSNIPPESLRRGWLDRAVRRVHPRSVAHGRRS